MWTGVLVLCHAYLLIHEAHNVVTDKIPIVLGAWFCF